MEFRAVEGALMFTAAGIEKKKTIPAKMEVDEGVWRQMKANGGRRRCMKVNEG